MKLSNLFTFFTDTIFRKDERKYRTPWLRWMVKQYKLLFYTGRGLLEHGTIAQSAALTFYTIMSIVPILALIFAIVKGFGLTEELIQNIYSIFPQDPEVIDYIVDFAEKALANTQGGVVAFVGVVMLFWAVIRVFSSVESAFNNIWEVKVTRSLTRQLTDYIAVVMVAPILWIIASIFSGYIQDFIGLDDSTLSTVITKAASMAVTWVMFSFLYIVIPNTKVRFACAVTAGIVAGTAFILFQWGYIYLQQWMSSYNAIYGSFAALPLFLIWMQVSWEILLFGGELAFAYQNIDRFDKERESLLISYDHRRKVIIAVMAAIATHFRKKGGAVHANEIRDKLGLPTRIVNDVLFQLVKAGLLIEVRTDDDKETMFSPAKDIGTLTVYGVLEAVEQHGETVLNFTDSPEMARIGQEIESIKESTRKSGHDTRLIDIMP